jgi:hypothetical protein
MREMKRVRATQQRVPFPGGGEHLPGPRKEVDPDTGEVKVIPGASMPVPWVPYWRTRLEQGLIEFVADEPAEVLEPTTTPEPEREE